MEIPNTATVSGFLCFVSEVLNYAFLVYIYEDLSLYNASVGEYDILSGYIFVSSFDSNSSKLIKITQSETLYGVAGSQELIRKVDDSRYDIDDMPTIYDEERIVTFYDFISGGLDFCRFSIENGLEYLTGWSDIWNIHTKQLIIVGGRIAVLINYNSSQEIETTKITFSKAQLNHFLYFRDLTLAFMMVIVLVLISFAILLFLRTRK